MKNFKLKKKKMLKKYFNLGLKEILLTDGEKGSKIFNSDGDFYKIPAYKYKVKKDTTGCGDIYAATYSIFRYKGFNIKNSAIAASKVAGLKTSMIGIDQIKLKKIFRTIK